jgi:ATP-dependent exoDNAse (exonuclease V) alpha subunit
MTTQELLARKDFNYGLLTGTAGSGKTFLIRETIKLDPGWGLLCATTGAAARVLGPDIKTVHSTLGIFDLESLKKSQAKGDLHDVLVHLRKSYKRLIVDECSMLPRRMFEIIAAACERAGIGLILVGDFLQLPPVCDQGAEWLFHSKSWPKFAKNTITLTTQYRFANVDYITGINCLRSGNGLEAIPYLAKAGATFLPQGSPSKDFTGTIITATKSKRDVINDSRFAALTTEARTYKSIRGGAQITDWNEIPTSIQFKIGSRVMITRNLYDKENEMLLLQANGELGSVIELRKDSVIVERDDKSVVEVAMFDAHNGCQHKGHDGVAHTKVVDSYPTGYITYMPLTLAWAMNCHKVQGLSLSHPTRVVLENFFSAPAMVYVACSRVADPTHLILVGAGTTSRVCGSDVPEEVYAEPRIATWTNVDAAVMEFV